MELVRVKLRGRKEGTGSTASAYGQVTERETSMKTDSCSREGEGTGVWVRRGVWDVGRVVQHQVVQNEVAWHAMEWGGW